MRVSSPRLDAFKIAALAGLAVGIAVNLFFFLKSLPVPILEQHAFRQTQTAISAYWLIHGTADIFRYETPVLGFPWSIPMEFPLYQFIVAKLAVWSGLKLDTAGRLVSFIFHMLTAATGYAAIRRLRAGLWWGVVFAALYLCSPLYIFWGRSFMIETCATFFGMLNVFFICCFATEVNRLRRWAFHYPAAVAAAVACVMAKATTFPGFAAAGGFVVLVAYLRGQTPMRPLPLLFSLGSLVLLPLLPAFYWVAFSDKVKMLNPAGQTLTAAALSDWNFGTLKQRLGGKFWEATLVRAVRDSLGYHVSFLALLWGFWRLNTRHRIVAGALFLLYLLPFLIFANVQLWHNYYQVANAVFLILCAAAIICLLHRQSRVKLATGLLILVLFLQLATFSLGYYRDAAKLLHTPHPTISIAEFVKGNTPPGTAIIVFGYDWSSEIAYYAERKSFTVPGWFSYDNLLQTIDTSRQEMGGLPIAAIVDANNTRDAIRQQGKPDIFAGYRSVKIGNATVYYRQGSGQ